MVVYFQMTPYYDLT